MGKLYLTDCLADEKRSSVADDLTSEVLKELSIQEPKEAEPLLQGKF